MSNSKNNQSNAAKDAAVTAAKKEGEQTGNTTGTTSSSTAVTDVKQLDTGTGDTKNNEAGAGNASPADTGSTGGADANTNEGGQENQQDTTGSQSGQEDAVNKPVTDTQVLNTGDVGSLNELLGTKTETTSVATTQRKVILSAAPVNLEAKSASEAPVPVAPLKTIQPAVSVTETAAEGNDEQLVEVVKALEVGTVGSQNALVQLLEYVNDMAPGKPQTDDSVEQQQLKLIGVLNTVTISEDTNFPEVWKAVLAVVKVHRNKCFAPTYRSRGLNSPTSVKLIDNRSANFLTRIIDLLVVTSGVNSLAEVKKHVDFKTLEDTIFNVKARKNIIAYYSGD